MKNRALSTLGALVLLSAVSGNTAGAASLFANAVAENFSGFTNSQIDTMLNNYDKTHLINETGPLDLTAGTYKGNITYIEPEFSQYIIGAIYSGEITDEEFTAWKKFRSTITVIDSWGFGDTVPSPMQKTGECYIRTSARSFKGGTEPIDSKYELWTGTAYEGGTRYKISLKRVKPGMDAVEVAHAESNYLQDDIMPIIRDWTDRCVRRDEITLTAWRDGVFPVPTARPIADNVRGAGVALIRQSVTGDAFNVVPGIRLGPPATASELAQAAPDTLPPPGSGEPAPGGGGSGSPPCTKDDGNVSGNPYDCAPVDNVNNCSIIDLPCNIKWAFIPREDFFTQQLPEIFTRSFNMPIQVTDRIEVDIPFMDQTFRAGLNFNGLVMNDVFQGIVRLMCAFSCLYWLLNFFGIPNLFGGSVKGSSEVKTAIQRSRRTK